VDGGELRSAKASTDRANHLEMQMQPIRESRYRTVCKAQGKCACSLEIFTGEVAAFCKAVGIKRKTEGDHLYLVDVQLARLQDEAAI